MKKYFDSKTDQIMRKVYFSLTRALYSLSLLMVLGTFSQLSAQSQLACNNLVQVSLNDDCMVEITPDMILEGDHMSGEDFTIIIDGYDPVTYNFDGSPVVAGEQMFIDSIGTFKVTIRNANGNSCWGEITTEDKIPPVVDCEVDPIVTSCDQTYVPGDPILEKFVYSMGGVALANNNSQTLSFNTTSTGTGGVGSLGSTFIPTGSILTDINVVVEIDHDYVSCLSSTIAFNGGTPQLLFTSPGGTSGGATTSSLANCPGDNLMIRLDEQANQTHGTLQSTCTSATPTVAGSYQPENPLDASSIVGVAAPSTVDVTISDGCGSALSSGGTITNVTVEFVVRTGNISQPFDLNGAINPADISGPVNGMFTITNQGICGIVKATYQDEVTEENCSQEPGYSQIITRTWTAMDASGNTSTCMETIKLTSKDFDTQLTFPPNFDGIEMPPIWCKDVLPDANGNIAIPLDQYGFPDPSYTGFPFDWSDVNLNFSDNGTIGNDDTFCGLVQMVYNDIKIDICSGSYKVLRQWQVLDWCTGDNNQGDQIIKVVPEPVIISCIQVDTTISITTGHDCVRDYTFDPSGFDIFSCHTIINEGVEYLLATTTDAIDCVAPPGSDTAPDFLSIGGFAGTSNSNGTYTLRDLPLGCSWVRYYVETDCGDVTECRFEVTVVDEVAPSPVCEQSTVVALGPDGWARVRATSFDDGSWDNCGEIVTYEVAKMSSTCGENGQFKSEIDFCCADVGNTVMVALRVTDAAGNSEVCMVETQIQDKYAPTFTCPADMTLDCGQDFTDLSLTGQPTDMFDNCSFNTPTSSDRGSLSSCGVGTIFRTWTITDAGGKATTCVQRISVIDNDLFDGNDIIWPRDETLTNTCLVDLDPLAGNVPNISFNSNEFDCAQVAATWEDLTFTFADDACEKVLRTWTVIDWCQYSGGGTTGIWSRVQEIKLVNNIAPTISSGCATDNMICGYGACNETITLSAAATDDCTATEDIKWSYQLDANADGSFESVSSTTTGVDTFKVTRNIPFGTHVIRWIAEDGCGNTETCEKRFTVRDCKAPTPYCLSVVNTVVMPVNGQIAVWANDFNLASTDNCTPADDLLFSFSQNTTQTSITFTCDDISDGQSEFQQLEMWVTDAAGNQDFCKVLLQIQDNSTNPDVCPDVSVGTIAFISGAVYTEENEYLENVTVDINSNQPEYPKSTVTDIDGAYSFQNLEKDFDYEVAVNHNDDPMNGVSTLDLVLIQRHILGINDLNSAYKILAADVDNSQNVSAADLVYLRKMILGIKDGFTNGQNEWRFVPQHYSFPNPTNPFPYMGIMDLEELSGNINTMDFVGMKIGDVNTSVALDGINTTEVRSDRVVTFTTENQVLNSDIVSIPVAIEGDYQLAGMQFTIKYDESIMSFADISSENINLDETHVGTRFIDRGMITVSWNEMTETELANGETVFTLDFNITNSRNAELKEVFALTSDFTTAEAYNADLTVSDIELSIKDVINSDLEAQDFALYQNTPNPFSSVTNIGFKLPEQNQASIKVYDATGKLVYSLNETFNKGYNEVSINIDDMNATGVLYYTLESGSMTATKRMVILK